MKVVWVLGAGGLLGSALRRQLAMQGDIIYTPERILQWSSLSELRTQLAENVTAFAECIGKHDQWEVYWAAGIGTMASPADSLIRETEALEMFLSLLGLNLRLASTPGAIGFASSAGAIYAGTAADIINEQTPISPSTPYAIAKLKQEELIHSFTASRSGIGSLIARFSTLYGTGQATGKKQGLLTHIARSIVLNQPIQIYVPFDTIRDYILVTDAAVRMIVTLRNTIPSQQVLKIIAAERPTTIAEIVSTFKRLARRPPRIVTSATQLTALYGRKMQFHSNIQIGGPATSTTSLAIGIAQLLDAERKRFVTPMAKLNASS